MSGPSKRFPIFSRNLSCEGLRSCRSSRPRPRLRRPRRHQISGSSTSCVHRKTVRLRRRQLLPVLAPDRGSLRTEGPKLGRVQEVKQPLATSTAKKASTLSARAPEICETNEVLIGRQPRLGYPPHIQAALANAIETDRATGHKGPCPCARGDTVVWGRPIAGAAGSWFSYADKPTGYRMSRKVPTATNAVMPMENRALRR